MNNKCKFCKNGILGDKTIKTTIDKLNDLIYDKLGYDDISIYSEYDNHAKKYYLDIDFGYSDLDNGISVEEILFNVYGIEIKNIEVDKNNIVINFVTKECQYKPWCKKYNNNIQPKFKIGDVVYYKERKEFFPSAWHDYSTNNKPRTITEIKIYDYGTNYVDIRYKTTLDTALSEPYVELFNNKVIERLDG